MAKGGEDLMVLGTHIMDLMRSLPVTRAGVSPASPKTTSP